MKRFKKVALDQIKFRFKDSDHTNSCLPLVPLYNTWQAEQRSHVAYSIEDTKAARDMGKMLIWAHVEKRKPNEFIQVRATFMPPKPLDFIAERMAVMHKGQEVLGEVAPTLVAFDETGNSVYRGTDSHVPLPIMETKFDELGPGVYDINWRWEFRNCARITEDDEIVWDRLWRPFGISNHRVYLVNTTPSFPWSAKKVNSLIHSIPHSHPLWVETLYIACLWAKGAKSLEEIPKIISDKLYACGRFEYQTSPAYTEIVQIHDLERNHELAEELPNGSVYQFELSKFVSRISGGNGLGKGVNCLDCAMAVMALSNAMGCKLRVGKLQNTPSMDYTLSKTISENQFEILPLKAIGIKDTQTTMKGLATDGSHYFSYHSIAWENKELEGMPLAKDFTEDSTIYDACVLFSETDANGNENFVSASGSVLGKEDTNSFYRSKLAAPTENGRPRCKPQPSTVLPVQIV